MKRIHLTASSLLLLAGLIDLPQSGYCAESYDGNRWFQIEISVFSNEDSSDREEEVWLSEDLNFGSLTGARRLDQFHQFFQLSEFNERVNGIPAEPAEAVSAIQPANQPITSSIIDFTADASQIAQPESGPFPYQHDAELRFFDFSRDPYLQLPASESQFTQTNRAIERSPAYRLLFYGLWRQPVLNTSAATTLYVDGGRQYGKHHELQGTITIHFNPNQDRVVIDTDLLLAEFGRLGNDQIEWTLPELPDHLRQTVSEEDAFDFNTTTLDPELQRLSRNRNSTRISSESVTRIFQLKQSRDMRSGEFHYLDHPALGVVVMVMPYDLPLPESELDTLEELTEEALLPLTQ